MSNPPPSTPIPLTCTELTATWSNGRWVVPEPRVERALNDTWSFSWPERAHVRVVRGALTALVGSTTISATVVSGAVYLPSVQSFHLEPEDTSKPCEIAIQWHHATHPDQIPKGQTAVMGAKPTPHKGRMYVWAPETQSLSLSAAPPVQPPSQPEETHQPEETPPAAATPEPPKHGAPMIFFIEVTLATVPRLIRIDHIGSVAVSKINPTKSLLSVDGQLTEFDQSYDEVVRRLLESDGVAIGR